MDAAEAIFGAFDGTTSVLGVMLAVGVTHSHALLLAAVGLAVSSAVGMAGGEWLTDNGRGAAAALTIGAATGVGTLAPVAPFLAMTGTAALAGGLAVIAAAGAAIAVFRTRHRRRGQRAWAPTAQTFAILGIAAAASAGAAVALGGGG